MHALFLLKQYTYHNIHFYLIDLNNQRRIWQGWSRFAAKPPVTFMATLRIWSFITLYIYLCIRARKRRPTEKVSI